MNFKRLEFSIRKTTYILITRKFDSLCGTRFDIEKSLLFDDFRNLLYYNSVFKRFIDYNNSSMHSIVKVYHNYFQLYEAQCVHLLSIYIVFGCIRINENIIYYLNVFFIVLCSRVLKYSLI